jgi:hypothetical protein
VIQILCPPVDAVKGNRAPSRFPHENSRVTFANSMRTFFQALTLAVLAGPMCATAAPALKGIYKAGGLGLLDVSTNNGRVVGKFRTGGNCPFSVDDEVLSGAFEGNVFVGTVQICQTGEGCPDGTKLYPLMAFVVDKELSGEVPLPDNCTSAGLEGGHRFLLAEANAQERATALQPTKAITDKLPRNASKKERDQFAAKELNSATEHFNKGRYGLAADGFELSIAAGSDGWSPVMMLGVCKVKERKWKDGKAMIERGLKMGGKNVPPELRALAEYALAVVAENNGTRPEALSRLQKAVALSAAPGAMVNEMKHDPDLKELRQDAGFNKFLEDLEKQVQKTAKKPKGG